MELTIVEDIMGYTIALRFLENLLLSHQNNNNCNNTIKPIKNHSHTQYINMLTYNNIIQSNTNYL